MRTKLMEPDIVKNICYTLRNNKECKDNSKIIYFNSILTVIFFGVVGLFLYFKHKTKQTKEEIEKKKKKSYEEIVKHTKNIRMYQNNFFNY